LDGARRGLAPGRPGARRPRVSSSRLPGPGAPAGDGRRRRSAVLAGARPRGAVFAMAGDGSRPGAEVVRDVDHDHAAPEEERPLDEERGLVVEEVLPPP